ncbi:MAG: serine/threonine protein kinase [Ktedonobacteraceae bacterium]|nr:serine/threonine protein kinase [Ktedonobacteraceae bacterium]
MSENQRLDQCIGNYRLQHLLSRSRSAEIYLAKHTLFHTEAVVKLLNRHSTSDESEKFLAQASLLTHLQHPHIVRALDFGKVDETAFLIMNYAPNGTLRQRYPKGTRLPIPTILHYSRQIASALQYIHLHNLIHRDIKPHNMLLGENDDVLLTDFGIAVVAQDFTSYTPAFRDFEGTVLYAAPEQLQGRPHKNSDLYALGIIIYEWLCGDWPFTGSFEETAHQHLFVSPPFFSEKGVEVSPEIEQVVRKALEKEPEQRFSDAEDFLYALEQAYQSIQLSTPVPEVSKISSRRQFMSPLPFIGETIINRAG